jgi:hypothetical protein
VSTGGQIRATAARHECILVYQALSY